MRAKGGQLGRSRQVTAARKPGWKPPAALLARLKRLHPRVELIYSPKYKKWALAERLIEKGGYAMIGGPIEGRPNLGNTVKRLGDGVILRRNWRRWLESAERNEDAMRAGKHVNMDRMNEGAERLHLLNSTRKVVALGSAAKRS